MPLYNFSTFGTFVKLLLCYLESMNDWKQQEPKATNDFGGKSSWALPFCQTALKVVLLFPMIPRNATLCAL
jgi:hypothetical protein